MTQEDKQLLLKDLCAMLPYGVMVSVHGGEFESYMYPYQLTAVSKFGLDSLCKVYNPVYTPFGCPKVEDVKPYLRPMSSMTEEEKKEFDEVLKSCNNKVFACSDQERRYNFFDAEQEDFMNAYHFDYRGLIPMGLALEAPEGMYK